MVRDEILMPGGDKAWFVRRKHGWGCDLRPVSRAGHFLTALFTGWIGLITWLAIDREPLMPWLLVWSALLLVGAVFYIVIALRMSAPAPEARRTQRR